VLEMEAVDEGCEWAMQLHTCSLRTWAAGSSLEDEAAATLPDLRVNRGLRDFK
jgi:hypothetical protein